MYTRLRTSPQRYRETQSKVGGSSKWPLDPVMALGALEIRYTKESRGGHGHSDKETPSCLLSTLTGENSWLKGSWPQKLDPNTTVSCGPVYHSAHPIHHAGRESRRPPVWRVETSGVARWVASVGDSGGCQSRLCPLCSCAYMVTGREEAVTKYTQPGASWQLCHCWQVLLESKYIRTKKKKYIFVYTKHPVQQDSPSIQIQINPKTLLGVMGTSI